jgi:spermidine synthase
VPRRLLFALAALVFLSGISALVYQVLWLRLLSLTFGVTIHAASTVLAAFMAGLAAGAFAAGRLADRSSYPLRLFGLVELLIGFCALLTPAALAAVHGVYVALFARFPESAVVAAFVRFVLPFAVLMVPTALMGATLPLVMKSSLTRIEGLGTRAGLLYATNTAGAIVGALAAGLYLIPQVGLRRSFLLAAAVNGLVGVSALILSRMRERARAPDDASALDAAAPVSGSEASPAIRMGVLAVFAVSGFASLALEIVWFRALAILLGPSSFAFTLMLAAVLLGIALGSALVTPFMQRRFHWLQVLAALQIAAGLVAIRSFHSLRRPARPPEWLEPMLESSSLAYMVPAAAASVAAILPTAIFFGLAFPVGLRLWAGDGRRTAERIGLFYSVNVCGGILGSIVAGFVLLPRLGSRGSLIALAALFLLSGLALQAAVARRRPIETGLAVLAALVFLAWAREVPSPTALPRYLAGRPVLFHEEGVQTTVTVFGGPGTGNRVMYIDSYHQANDQPNMVFVHARIGLLPALLHPQPRRALVVGLGGGASAGALSQYPGIHVDVVELSPGVVRGAEQFAHVNFDVLRRPNVTTWVGDGRNQLLRTRGRYDVITADAIIPTNAGANNLYSAEYFKLVSEALAPGGIALHWNGADGPAHYGLILRAFVKAFPQTTLWADGKLMIGWKDPPSLSRERIETMLGDPVMRDVLKLMHVERFDHLARMFRANPDQARALAGEGPYLTDDRPMIEYFARLPPQVPVDLAGIRGDIGTILR